MGDARLSAAQMRQLRKDEQKKEAEHYAKQYQGLAAEAEGIPLRSKAQHPMYVEVRTLHLLRGIAKIEGVAVQELVREALDDVIDKRMRKIPKKKPRGSGNTKRAS
jgi:hypothetical protein